MAINKLEMNKKKQELLLYIYQNIQFLLQT